MILRLLTRKLLIFPSSVQEGKKTETFYRT